MSAATPHAHRAVVPPLHGSVTRPVWSVMIPTYNCARYLRCALTSVLSQDPGVDLMQIEVVDDCSTADDPEAIVREVGHGRVSFFRQDRNVGHVRNFDTCLQRSRGNLVHLLHGDDYVLDGFYATMGRPFEEHPNIGAAFCRHVAIDEDGHWFAVSPLLQRESGIPHDWLERIARGQLLQPPSIVVRRAVYERLGGFDRRIETYGEDWEMWVRIAASYPVWYQVEPLSAYRVQTTASLSGRAMRSGQNMRDLETTVCVNEAVLPANQVRQLSHEARVNNALGAIRRAHRMLHAGEVRVPLTQLREALRSSPTQRVAFRGALLLGHWVWVIMRRAREHR